MCFMLLWSVKTHACISGVYILQFVFDQGYPDYFSNVDDQQNSFQLSYDLLKSTQHK